MAKFNLKQALEAAEKEPNQEKAREMRRLAHGTARQIQRKREQRVKARRSNLIASTMKAIYG